METEKSFVADNGGLVGCQEFLASICDSPKPQIIMDEIVSNIVRCSEATKFTIRCEHRDTEGVVSMVFIDDGKAFDPTKDAKEPDVTASIEDRKIGGLGLFMVRKMSKTLSYRRENNCNILSVTL